MKKIILIIYFGVKVDLFSEVTILNSPSKSWRSTTAVEDHERHEDHLDKDLTYFRGSLPVFLK